MRTTVDLDGDIEYFLRQEALRTRRSFKRVLNETLRAAMVGTAPTPKSFSVNARPMGLRAGLDPLGFSKLSDELEAAAFLDATRKLQEHTK